MEPAKDLKDSVTDNLAAVAYSAWFLLGGPVPCCTWQPHHHQHLTVPTALGVHGTWH